MISWSRKYFAAQAEPLLGQRFESRAEYLASLAALCAANKALQVEFDEFVYELFEGKAGYRHSQPRWLAGNGRISGRWSGGAGTGAANQPSSGSTRGGHHFVPRKLFDKEPLRPETRKIFQDAVTGPLKGQEHRGGKDNEPYFRAVKELYDNYLAERGLRANDLRPEHAKEIVDLVKQSRVPQIRNYNLRIYVREIMNAVRFRYLRGNE